MSEKREALLRNTNAPIFLVSLKSKKKLNPYKTNLIQAIDQLSDYPRPDGCKKLKGSGGFWRIRVNDYRIVYQIKDEQLLILIIRIGHRKDIYEGL